MRVTVVIPTFGRWEFVPIAVGAALRQTGVEVEVLVVADGPAAGAHAGVRGLDDARVRVHARPDRTGVAAARNRGIDAASGEWVALLDDDDVWAPDKLSSQVAAAVASGADFSYSSGAVVEPDMTLRFIEHAPPPALLAEHMVRNNPIPACPSNLLIRTDVARRVRFDPELMIFADWDFAVRLIQSAQGAMCPQVHVGYVHHSEAMHYQRLAGIESEFARFRAKHGSKGLALGGPSQSRWIAGAHRESGRRWRAAQAYARGALRYRSPPDLMRAVAVLLGEPAMRVAARQNARPVEPAPPWLATYR